MITKEQLQDCTRKIHRSEMRILSKNGFYGSLLMHVIFAVDTKLETVSCDSKRIYFNPEFLLSLTNDEIDYVLMHQILHIALLHTVRSNGFQKKEFGTACDIVVDSNIYHSCGDDERSIRLNGETAKHRAPDGTEGYQWAAEQLYDILLAANPKGSSGGDSKGDGEGDGDGDKSDGTGGKGGRSQKKGKNGKAGNKASDSGQGDDGDEEMDSEGVLDNASSGNAGGGKGSSSEESGGFDSHSKWEGTDEDGSARDEWLNNLHSAAKMAEIMNPSKSRGLIPVCAERILKELAQPQVDWKALLVDFVQQEICDYSFSPPDRRFEDSPFFLPDYNEKDDTAENILFMVDTSGSMSDTMVTEAFSEIKGAIDQFGGKLKGWLGFFDAEVVEPQPFENEDEFRIIRPKGGGGTSFDVIFDYVAEKMDEIPPACIIILTDGYAPYPEETAAGEVPVMWLINNEESTPPWGKIVRIKSSDGG